jgi:iron-sulfur cluster assembly accessory protein
MIEITDEAIQQLLANQRRDKWKNIRLGITGGGCAGFEYVFDSSNDDGNADDIVLDYGKFNILINKMSVPYLSGMTLDFITEGLNKLFKFVNPKEEASCGCGVSINFDLEKVEVDANKIFAVEL